MEIFGNSMTAHFWHFKKIDFDLSDIPNKMVLNVGTNTSSFRVFHKNRFFAVLTSAFVDINPLQTCLVIKPKNSNKPWKLFYPLNLEKGKFEEEKCSHIGEAKIIVDGNGCVLARDIDGNFLELEIVQHCLAWQRTDVLFI